MTLSRGFPDAVQREHPLGSYLVRSFLTTRASGAPLIRDRQKNGLSRSRVCSATRLKFRAHSHAQWLRCAAPGTRA
jgi:hypothetical protein